jgi:hypothetical protein
MAGCRRCRRCGGYRRHLRMSYCAYSMGWARKKTTRSLVPQQLEWSYPLFLPRMFEIGLVASSASDSISWAATCMTYWMIYVRDLFRSSVYIYICIHLWIYFEGKNGAGRMRNCLKCVGLICVRNFRRSNSLSVETLT